MATPEDLTFAPAVLRNGALIGLTAIYAAALVSVRHALTLGRDLGWPLLLVGCALAMTALLARDPQRSKQGVAAWLLGVVLLALADGAALPVLGAAIGVLVLAGAERFGDPHAD